MGLNINPTLPIGVVENNISVEKANISPRVSYGRYATVPDTINVNTDVQKYLSRGVVDKMIVSNPKILKMLSKKNPELKVNYKALEELSRKHLQDTKRVVTGIADNLPLQYQSEINFPALSKAAMLHDIGKVLIPKKILNKRGKFSEKEYEVMKQHANLGYELLKSTNIDEDTLKLVKYHHQNAQKTGYPKVEGNYVSDINSQILYAADLYSALREKRSYKEAFSKNKSLSIIHETVSDGKLHPQVFKALVDYANKAD